MQSGDCYLFDGLQVTDSAQLHCGPGGHLDPRLEPMAGYDGSAEGQSCASANSAKGIQSHTVSEDPGLHMDTQYMELQLVVLNSTLFKARSKNYFRVYVAPRWHHQWQRQTTSLKVKSKD